MVVSPFGLTLEQLARAHAMMGDNDAAQVVSGLSHSLEQPPASAESEWVVRSYKRTSPLARFV